MSSFGFDGGGRNLLHLHGAGRDFDDRSVAWRLISAGTRFRHRRRTSGNVSYTWRLSPTQIPRRSLAGCFRQSW